MKTRVALLLLALLLVAGFTALGRWQWQRGAEKKLLLASAAGALDRDRVLPLSAAGSEGGYDWAAGSGRFRPAPVLLLDNQRRGAQVGVQVFGVFEPAQGPALLVDLGWLPLPGDRQLPDTGPPPGELTVSGLLAPPPAAGIALGPAHVVVDSRRWLLTRLDRDALGQALGLHLAPRVLRLDPELPIGHVRDLALLPNTLPPERHRGYALQWFGLALLTAVFSLFLAFRRQTR